MISPRSFCGRKSCAAVGQGLAGRPGHADAPFDIPQVDAGSASPAPGGPDGGEPDCRFAAACEVGGAARVVVDMMLDQAGEIRVAIAGFRTRPWQHVRPVWRWGCRSGSGLWVPTTDTAPATSLLRLAGTRSDRFPDHGRGRECWR